jgi:hypothetical protein
VSRTTIALAGFGLGLALLASGCSGGDPAKEGVLGELRKQVEDSGASQEYVDCIIDGIGGLGVAELQSIRDDTATAETNAVVDAVLDTCIPVEQ